MDWLLASILFIFFACPVFLLAGVCKKPKKDINTPSKLA